MMSYLLRRKTTLNYWHEQGKLLGLLWTTLSLFSFAHSVAFASPHNLLNHPPLDTDLEKMQLILSIRDQVPDLFDQSATFNIQLMSLLDQEHDVLTKLDKIPAYREAMAKRATLSDIEIRPVGLSTVRSYKLDPNLLENWKNELKLKLQNFSKSSDVAKDLLEKEKELIVALGTKTSFGLKTGLMLCLPPELRANASVESFETNLPETLPATFRSSNFGLNSPTSKAEALQLLHTIMQEEERLRELLQLHLALMDSSGHVSGSLHQLSEHIENLTLEKAHYLMDADGFNNSFNAIAQVLKTNEIKSPPQPIRLAVSNYFSKMAQQKVETVEELGRPLRLIEVPPTTGIFRGCTGGDCSSQYSFPYPNDPSERVYFIYGEDNELKGYATGTILEAGGKKSFYLMTIASPRLSSGDIELVLHGLETSKSKLGFEQLVLPTSNNIKELINFIPIRETLERYAQKGKSVLLKYDHAEVRSLLEQKRKYNSGSYDKMAANTSGVIFEPNAEQKVVVHLREVPVNFPSPHEVTPEIILEFGLELRQANRETDLRRLVKLAGKSIQDFDELSATFENKNHKKVEDFISEVESKCKFMGLPEDFGERNLNLLRNGLFHAPDLAGSRFMDQVPKLISYFKHTP